MIGELERRLMAAQPPAEPGRAAAGTEAHHRRVAVARMAQERARTMADPDASPLRRARMRANASQRALSILAGCSRDAVSRAERGDDRVSLATWRRLATALGCDVAEIKP
jgi:DNA-binding XRE family transcriptional regulator